MAEFKKVQRSSREHSFENRHNYAQLLAKRQSSKKKASSNQASRKVSPRVQEASPFAHPRLKEKLARSLQRKIEKISAQFVRQCSRKALDKKTNTATENSNVKRSHSNERKSRHNTSQSSLVCTTFEPSAKGSQELIQFIMRSFKATALPPPTQPDFYKISQCLGKGAFGKVYLGIHKLTGLTVAIKVIDKTAIRDEKTQRKVMNEVLVMKRVVHPNVIRLLEMFETTHHLVIVQEHAGGGDLLHFIKSRGRLPEDEAKLLFRQIAQGVKACHSHNVAHRDIKLDNVLLNTDLTIAKLCDFGVSRLAKPGEKVPEQCGTPAYLAPEIIVNQGYDPFYVDLWSMGILLYAILCGTVPFRAKTLPELNKLILRGRYEMPGNLSDEAQDLIKRLLNPVPQLRISFEELETHLWFLQSNEESFDDSILPRFLGETVQDSYQFDREHVLGTLQKFGFPREYVVNSLQFNDLNHATATYHLLELHQASHNK